MRTVTENIYPRQHEAGSTPDTPPTPTNCSLQHSHPHPHSRSRTILLPLSAMSHTHTAASSSSSNFQLIIDNALDTYKKRTKKDLLAHPLAARLQTCDTPSDIIAILQEQVQGPDQSRSSNERRTKWLDPTVNVLHAFSSILEVGASMVCFRTCISLRFTLSCLCGRHSHLRK